MESNDEVFRKQPALYRFNSAILIVLGCSFIAYAFLLLELDAIGRWCLGIGGAILLSLGLWNLAKMLKARRSIKD